MAMTAPASDATSLTENAIRPDALMEESDRIHAKDLATLSSVPGLGTKRAQRLILELGNALAEPVDSGKRGKKSSAHPLADILTPPLVKLGYTKEEIQTMLAALPKEHATPEAALQYLLKHAR